MSVSKAKHKEVNMIEAQETTQQIERIGVFFEKSGMPPVASRIIGLLMLAEPPYKTFEEIVETVNASKSSVSNAIKFLQQEELIDYITFPGDRKRYFQLNTHSWLELLKKRIKGIGEFREVLRETVEIRSDKYADFNQTLLEIRELYGEFQNEVMNIIERWERRRKKS